MPKAAENLRGDGAPSGLEICAQLGGCALRDTFRREIGMRNANIPLQALSAYTVYKYATMHVYRIYLYIYVCMHICIYLLDLKAYIRPLT